MNLSEWASRVGVSRFTAYRWFREGTLPVPARRAGRLILVDVLPDPGAQTVVAGHRDRLPRFGTEHLEVALPAQGRQIVVVDEGEADDDLVRDMTGVLTSFCGRLYGRRGARNRALKALGCARNDVGPMALRSGKAQ